MEDIDLTRIERRAWRSYHQDGLIDLALGVLLLFVFAGSIADHFHWVAIVLLLLVGPSLALAKRLLTAPRMGTVEFSAARKTRKRRVVLFIALLVAATTLIPVFGGGEAWLRSHGTFVSFALGVWIFAAFAAMAFWLDLQRMYGVGLLFGAAFTLTELLDTPLPLLFAGTLVALSGIVRLVAFLRRYPKPTGLHGTR